ncbi:MAG: cell division protein FtsQ [Marinobacter sp. 34-60-7]|nr:MAG: cell division protein FtsQ [Marinobacter sp. 34-60-7]
MVAVDEGESGPPFAYTIGLSAKFGSPELCVAGLSSRAANELLGKLVEDVGAGRLSLDGDHIPAGIHEAQDCVWRRVHPSQFVGDNQVAVERAASAWIGKSYFATDLADIKAELEQRPWVDSAAVKRVWPGRLEIDIREKKPLAYWSDGRLVSRAGELFAPPNPDVAGSLPMLSGPDEQVREVISMARTMSDKLVGYGLGFAGLSLEQRGAWTLTLSNGIEVVLGRDQVEERFERFIAVYENRLAARVDEVSRIDARYSNGVAVQWKSDVAQATPKS